MEIPFFLFLQNTVSGNCDGFEKEKILKTSRVAFELTIIPLVGSIHQ